MLRLLSHFSKEHRHEDVLNFPSVYSAAGADPVMSHIRVLGGRLVKYTEPGRKGQIRVVFENELSNKGSERLVEVLPLGAFRSAVRRIARRSAEAREVLGRYKS